MFNTFGQQKAFGWTRRKVLKWMRDIAIGASVVGLGLKSFTQPAEASSNAPLMYPCPGDGMQAIVCLCPEPECSSNKARTLVTYQGGQAFDICLCPQSFVTYGCCDRSMSCYCSSE